MSPPGPGRGHDQAATQTVPGAPDDLPRSEGQSVLQYHGVSPKVFLEGLFLDLCLIEGNDSEEHALIKSYFDYVQRDP